MCLGHSRLVKEYGGKCQRYKIIHDVDKMDREPLPVCSQRPPGGIKQQQIEDGQKQNYFAQCTINVWTSLPQDMVRPPGTDGFEMDSELLHDLSMATSHDGLSSTSVLTSC